MHWLRVIGVLQIVVLLQVTGLPALEPGVHELAYLAEQDESPQPYYLYVPKAHDGRRALPCIVYLHGYAPDLNKLNWALFPEALLDYCDRFACYLVAPFGRSNTDFRGIGEADVLHERLAQCWLASREREHGVWEDPGDFRQERRHDRGGRGPVLRRGAEGAPLVARWGGSDENLGDGLVACAGPLDRAERKELQESLLIRRWGNEDGSHASEAGRQLCLDPSQ